MKKNILFATMLALSATVLTSCDKDTEGLSSITSYAILELNGDSHVTMQKGENFADPGCKATIAGEDVSDQIVTTSNINANRLGFYTVNYSVVNSDGFAASASRSVAVVDRNSFASTYYSECAYGSGHFYNLPINITDNGDGTYNIDDLAGGMYCWGRYPGYDAYGYDFFLEATLKLNADNTIEVLEQGDWYWGDPMEDVQGSYDPATGTVTLVMDFGAPFYVTLTK